MAFDRSALTLFLGAGSPALPEAARIVLLGSLGFVCSGVAMVLFGTIRANGEVWGPLVALFIAMYPVRLGFAYAARDWLGADALWWSFPLGMTAVMVMGALLHRYGGWREGRILPPESHECLHHAGTCAEPAAGGRPGYRRGGGPFRPLGGSGPVPLSRTDDET